MVCCLVKHKDDLTFS